MKENMRGRQRKGVIAKAIQAGCVNPFYVGRPANREIFNPTCNLASELHEPRPRPRQSGKINEQLLYMESIDHFEPLIPTLIRIWANRFSLHALKARLKVLPFVIH